MTRLLPHQADFTAGIEALLDDSDDCRRAARLRIAELEGALVRVRSLGAARIAGSCRWQRRLEETRESARQWTNKAAIARAAGRDDLANAALAEAKRANDDAAVLTQQIDAAIPYIREFESNLARIEYALSCLRQAPRCGPVEASRLSGFLP